MTDVSDSPIGTYLKTTTSAEAHLTFASHRLIHRWTSYSFPAVADETSWDEQTKVFVSPVASVVVAIY